MKKVILGTTALVLTAGGAFAEAHSGVSVGGFAGIWAQDLGDNIEIVNEIGIEFSGSGETDGGLGFGFDYTLLDATSDSCADLFVITDTGTTTTEVCAGGGAAAVDNWEVYISGSWGRLTVGDTDDALEMVAGIGDIGFDGLGLDNVAEFGRSNAGGAQGVRYSNTLGAATVYLSMEKDTGDSDMAIGVSFDAGPVTVGIGYRDLDPSNFVTVGAATVEDVTALDLSGSLGVVGFDVYYEDHAAGNNYGTILSYDAGMATLQFGLADGDQAVDTAVGVGFSTDLGGGAELAGGVVDNGTDTVWDLGIGMSF